MRLLAQEAFLSHSDHHAMFMASMGEISFL